MQARDPFVPPDKNEDLPYKGKILRTTVIALKPLTLQAYLYIQIIFMAR